MRLVLFLLLLTFVVSTEVDNLNVLLPELKLATTVLPLQLITAQGGCYHWSSSAPEILAVTSNDSIAGSCSRQAIIQIAQVGAFHSSIFVTATDVNTQSILNIPVRIRKINKIAIVTKSRMMNIKEIQKLELLAFDADENTFTSLQGLRFKWILEQTSQIIESVPLAHAQLYLPLKTRQQMQKNGEQSDILVVQALAPGNLKIIVRCIEAGYQHLQDQITLSVHQRFQLQPGPKIWMAPGSNLQLSLVRPTQEHIRLPQSYYSIVSCPGFTINSSLFLTGSIKPSVCTIKVEDTRTRPSYVSSVEIIVQNPDQIRIIADPIIVVGMDFPYRVQLLRKNVLLSGLAKNLKVSSDFPIIPSLQIISPQKKMTGPIKADFQNLTQVVKISALLPVRVVLPNDSLHLPVDEQFKLRVVGGSGFYEYFISSQIAVVTSQGVIIGKQPGQANLTISDRNYPPNKATVGLKVSSIASVQDLEQVKEVNRDQWGFFYLIARNQKGKTFTQCHQSKFQISLPSSRLDIDKKVDLLESLKKLANNTSKLVEQAITATSLLQGRQNHIISDYSIYVRFGELQSQELRSYVRSLQNYGICSIIKYRSQIGLQQKVVLSLVGNQQIKTSLSLRVYEPLINNIQNGNSSFLLTPSSSLTWNFSGGSRPWPATTTKVTLNSQPNQEGEFPVIVCPNKQTAFTSYKLQISNQQTRSLLFPTSQHSTIRVGCKFPKKLQLVLEYGLAYEQIFVNTNSNILGWVQPLDELNQRFYNSSNVQYSHYAQKGILQGLGKNFSYLSKEGSDLIKITSQKLRTGLYFQKVQVSLSITVVNPLVINHLLYDRQKFNQSDTKKSVTILTLFTPKKPYILNLKNASPLLNAQCTQAVACEYGQNSLIVKLLSLGRGKAVIRDKKIYGNSQWQFNFVIVEVDEVTVNGERNYMQEVESVNLSVNYYYQNSLISPLLYEINSLQLILDRGLKVLEQQGNSFVVRAEKEGNYSIYGEKAFPTVLRSRNPFYLYVYQKIQPNIYQSVVKKSGNILVIEGSILIVSGCRRLLIISGGPPSQSISYQSDSGIKVNVYNPSTYYLQAGKEGTYFVSFTLSFLNRTISIINIKVIVSPISTIELSSIDQPVVDAQFRILPRIRVGESEVVECFCHFEYKWSFQNGYLHLGKSASLGYLSAGGINATALVAGGEVVNLEVIDRQTQETIGRASKYIQILSRIDFQMPTLIDLAYSSSASVLLPPLTSYRFPKDYVMETDNGVIKIGQQSNKIESGKKLGHSFLQISRPGYKTELLQVEVLPISGVFISNIDSFIILQPYSLSRIPFYLQDKYGRLFITPLINLQIAITSSNSDILQASLSDDGSHLNLESYAQGTCLLTVRVGKNIQDSVAVSVGSQIKPSSLVRVLKNGIVQFSLASNQKAKWTSSNPQIAYIDEDTGLLKAKQLGRCKVKTGQLVGQVVVSGIRKVQQLVIQPFNQIQSLVIYRFLWQGDDYLEQLKYLRSHGAINNNFNPYCEAADKDLFETASQIVYSQGHQRLSCKIKFISSIQLQKIPNNFQIIVRGSEETEIQRFKYPFSPYFTFDTSKRHIHLSNQKSTEQIQIKTVSPVRITQTNGLRSWVKQAYDDERQIQTIVVDMSGQKIDWSWQLILQRGKQKQSMEIVFSSSGQVEKSSGSFWSLSLDWPDYLIILMGLIFAVVCFLQYINEEKIKNG